VRLFVPDHQRVNILRSTVEDRRRHTFGLPAGCIARRCSSAHGRSVP
jgi:hypothetical protein